MYRNGFVILVVAALTASACGAEPTATPTATVSTDIATPTATVLAGGLRPTPTPATPGADLRYDPFGRDRNCGDFDDWAEAQAFYVAAGGPESDWHRLDADRDGVACVALPGAP